MWHLKLKIWHACSFAVCLKCWVFQWSSSSWYPHIELGIFFFLCTSTLYHWLCSYWNAALLFLYTVIWWALLIPLFLPLFFVLLYSTLLQSILCREKIRWDGSLTTFCCAADNVVLGFLVYHIIISNIFTSFHLIAIMWIKIFRLLKMPPLSWLCQTHSIQLHSPLTVFVVAAAEMGQSHVTFTLKNGCVDWFLDVDTKSKECRNHLTSGVF